MISSNLCIKRNNVTTNLSKNIVYWLEWVGHVDIIYLILFQCPSFSLSLLSLLSVSFRAKHLH